MPRRILVLGSGFAGLWSALGAARKLDRHGVGPDEVEVVAVNRDAWHSIRVRNYEADLAGIRVPLRSMFDPVGIRHMEGEVFAIDVVERRVGVRQDGAETWLEYDRLVFALGSRLVRPTVPGLAAHGFDIDTFAGAKPARGAFGNASRTGNRDRFMDGRRSRCGAHGNRGSHRDDDAPRGARRRQRGARRADRSCVSGRFGHGR